MHLIDAVVMDSHFFWIFTEARTGTSYLLYFIVNCWQIFNVDEIVFLWNWI